MVMALVLVMVLVFVLIIVKTYLDSLFEVKFSHAARVGLYIDTLNLPVQLKNDNHILFYEEIQIYISWSCNDDDDQMSNIKYIVLR